MWREANKHIAVSEKEPLKTDALFEAGLIFSKFDDGKGQVTKEGFERLVKEYPQLVKPKQDPVATPQPDPNVPKEIVTGLMLTHYDETAGVPLSRSALDSHRSMGHMISPLAESYKVRYDKLRQMLTSKLLPRREHLLQLRRQLQNTSVEVAAAKRNIERETQTDTEQIMDRLRNAESLRQSAIKHQVLTLDEELENIERTIRRIEHANEEYDSHGPSGVTITSVTSGVMPVEGFRTPKATKMVELIQEYADLSSSIEHLAMKPLSVRVDFSTDDFPRETAHRLELISRIDKYTQAIAVKDQMLWTTLQEKEALQQSLKEEQQLGEEYAVEVSKWAEVAQKLSSELREMKQLYSNLSQKNNHLLSVLREHNIYTTEEIYGGGEREEY